LSFLIFFLISLYFSNINDTKLKQAEQILTESEESIEKSIQNLDENKEKELVIDNPEGWYLFGFTNLRPKICTTSCLCICKKSYISSQIETCNSIESGICTFVPNLKEDLSIEIKDPEDLTQILIKNENNEISIQEI